MKTSAGFTMVELVLVMVIIGVIAAIGVPRLLGDNSFAAATFGDEVISAMRTAQKSAVAKRRIVCAAIGGKEVTLRLASVPNAPSCDIALNSEPYKTTANGVSVTSHTLYFQPNGTITTDMAGLLPGSGAVTIEGGGTKRTISFEGTTGRVQ